MKCILLTGGAGYIGSHTAVELLRLQYQVTIVDNLVNSNLNCIHRIRQFGKVEFYNVDVRNAKELSMVFEKQYEQYGKSFDAVIHFAALKAVGESMEQPLKYYANNLTSCMVLLQVMEKFNCFQLIFSSSAVVYGTAALPLEESSSVGVGISNPYGKTKYMMEEMLKDIAHSTNGRKWGIIILRYFNPIGAHESGLIGEDPFGIPNNLMPYIAQVAVGRRDKVVVFGDDYKTKDGTGVRDYIHVVDVAKGHVAALKGIQYGKLKTFNLGSGVGYSVLDMIKGMEKASGKKIRYEIGKRRKGDVDEIVACPKLANQELNWKTTKDLHHMCEDQWKWQSLNPNGYLGP